MSPFFGGGALLSDLFNRGRINRAVISDLNKELINLYKIIKFQSSELIEALADESLHSSEDSFNMLRTEFNELASLNKDKVRRAALFIYLNKHGYNGLWRVNSSGGYNVPFGHYSRKNLPSRDTILQFSGMLKDVKIQCSDFSTSVRSAQKDDFVYFDPPYYPISKTASFTEYNQNGFGYNEQLRLARTVKRLSERGVQVMLSNSKTPEIETLYENFNISTVSAKRMINCNGEGRHGAYEIIVTNYEV